MSATYTAISEQEIRSFFHKWNETPRSRFVKELAFDFPVRDGVIIRCFTSVKDGTSRKVGKDAIRVFAVDTKSDRGFIKAKRVNRTTNWQDNLKKAYAYIFSETKNRLSREGR